MGSPTRRPTNLQPTLRVGGIVLCGGQSSRMGVAKATLPFGNESMLERVVGRLRGVVEPVVVVAAVNQPLPTLREPVFIARDEREFRGPLEGILAGLRSVAPHADAAFVTSCDVPLLLPAFVRRLIELLGTYEIIVPREADRYHPLAAVYRTQLVERIQSLLLADRLRPTFLFELAKTLVVPVDELRPVDADLASLRNLNRPEDYLTALAEAGLEAPPEIVALLQRIV